MSRKRLITLVAVIALIIPTIIAGISWFRRVRSAALDEECINNLRSIDGAKYQWALEKFSSKIRPLGEDYSARFNAVATEEDIHLYNSRNQYPMPHCPRGGKYTIGRVADAPTCSYPGHHLLEETNISLPDFFHSVLIDIHESEIPELIIGIEHGNDTPLRCKIDETWKATRFPSDMRLGIIAELHRLAGLPTSQFPSEGTFIIHSGSVQLKWRIQMESADAECILTPIRK